MDFERMFKDACRIHTDFTINRYLMANAYGRWDGAAKAMNHIDLCKFYTATILGISEEDVEMVGGLYEKIHEETQALTSHLDEQIGFPLEECPDYDVLAPLFFEKFHTIAMGCAENTND